MTSPSAASALPEWTTAVSRELGLDGASDGTADADTLIELATRIDGGVHHTAVPITAYLIGVAAGRADDPAVAARDFAEKIGHLADGWSADTERAEPANDQAARA